MKEKERSLFLRVMRHMSEHIYNICVMGVYLHLCMYICAMRSYFRKLNNINPSAKWQRWLISHNSSCSKSEFISRIRIPKMKYIKSLWWLSDESSSIPFFPLPSLSLSLTFYLYLIHSILLLLFVYMCMCVVYMLSSKFASEENDILNNECNANTYTHTW